MGREREVLERGVFLHCILRGLGIGWGKREVETWTVED